MFGGSTSKHSHFYCFLISVRIACVKEKRQIEKTEEMSLWKVRLIAFVLLATSIGVGYFVYVSETKPEGGFPFKLGLDLAGGTHLTYRADVSGLPSEEISGSMSALRDVIERRVNIFGVSEPIVQVEKSSVVAEGEREERLIVELPGVTDISEAVRLIGETPLLEFKLLRTGAELPEEPLVDETGKTPSIDYDEYFTLTELTGRYLKRAQLEFGTTGQGGLANEPVVILEFSTEGAEIFARITRENVGNFLAIFLDDEPISIPVIREEITGGTATISGNFRADEAKLLVRNLNFGALPVPIELIGTQSIGASLGADVLSRGVEAGAWGILFVALFLLLWYRLPGLLATLSLCIYLAVMLVLFKMIPVTLSAAGLAGFILSIGMAVDANILIFERMKEEMLRRGTVGGAVREGFTRAWLSIRDGNLSSILTAVVLFWFGTSLVKGFALVFGIGILVSMLTAISVSRTFLLALGNFENKGVAKFLFGSGTK